MPFAKFRTELAVKGGAAVMQDRMPFDEVALLQENKAYLLRWAGSWHQQAAPCDAVVEGSQLWRGRNGAQRNVLPWVVSPVVSTQGT